MSTGRVEGDPIRAWFLRGPTGRALREMINGDPSRVAVILAPGIGAPENIPAGHWRIVEGLRVAAVQLNQAVELAALRSPPNAARLRVEGVPAGCAWCLYVENARAVTWPFPLHPPKVEVPPRAAGDA